MKILLSGILFLTLTGSNSCIAYQQIGGTNTTPGTSEIADGLKQALEIGAQNAGNKLSAVDGYFKNAAIKILMPPEAKKVQTTLQNVGLGSLVDKAILSMNRAAEDAAKSAAPIFIDAIKKMTIADALQILHGSDTAATAYLRKATTAQLTNAFTPVIQSSLQKTDATRYWSDVFTAYNRIPFVKKINPDITAYVTQQALRGIFFSIGQEEQKIRENPEARVTDLLKKVFSKQ